MSTIHWKKFLHPGGVYRLEYPDHWEQLQKDGARSCGFGPHDRDDVGLWISLIPISVDTGQLADELPRMLCQVMPAGGQDSDVRRDSTLRHLAVKADIRKDGQGGCHWLIAGGDVVLYASSEVPAAERDIWNPLFERLLSTLEIMRDDELALRRLTGEVFSLLRQQHPAEHFEVDEKGIRGDGRIVYLGNLHREVMAAPARRSQIIQHFVKSLGASKDSSLGQETWADAQARLLPLLKPRGYVEPDSVGRNSLVNEWLGDVVICYALRSKEIFRFVTGADADRWKVDAQAIHQVAIANLCRLGWPTKLEGSRQRDGGRVMLVATGDGLASSRLLHPDLHRLLRGPLGSPFRAGTPDRDTLVVYSDGRRSNHKIERQIREDHRTSGYPITARPFLVTPDGIALAPP